MRENQGEREGGRKTARCVDPEKFHQVPMSTALERARFCLDVTNLGLRAKEGAGGASVSLKLSTAFSV